MRLLIFSLLAVSLLSCRQQPKQQVNDNGNVADEVLQELQGAIESNPDSIRLYDRIIDTLTNRGKFADAAAWCNRIINRGADSNYYYWFIKGDIYRRGQMFDSAISSYQTYLKKFPDDEEVLLNLANTYAEAGNKDAVDLANMIAARYPTREIRSQAAFIKGVYYNTVKQFSDATRWLDTAIIINYNYTEAYMEKGYSLYDQKKYSDALKTFSRLTELNRNDADGWYWVAKCEEAMGNNTEAINSYEQAFALNDSIVEAKQAIDRLKAKGKSQP